MKHELFMVALDVDFRLVYLPPMLPYYTVLWVACLF